MTGVPYVRITWISVALVALFLITGVILYALGQSGPAQGALGTATGIAIGTGATTVVVATTAPAGKADSGP